VIRGPSLEYVLDRHPQRFEHRRPPIRDQKHISGQVDQSDGSTDSPLEVWMTLEEIVEATGLSQAVLQYLDVTGKVGSRVVPTSEGGRKELLLADVMRGISSAVEEHQEHGGELRLDLETDNEMLRHQVDVLQSERELVERRAGLAQAIADERQERIHEMVREVERSRAERDEQAAAAAGLMTERDELLEEIARLTERRDQLAKDLEASDAEARGLAATLQRMTEIRQELENERLQLRTGNDELTKALEAGSDERRALIRDLERTKAERVEALRRVDEAEATARALERGLSEVKRVADMFMNPRRTASP
jgi:chromosome segregation ATPase